MKRAIGALTALGIAAMSALPAAAATQSGAVQAKWNVTVSATLVVATNYNTAANQNGAQLLTANSLQPSAAGVCANAASESAFTLTYGALAPSVTSAVACNYQQAISALVTTNSINWSVTQWVDVAPTAGVGFCAFSNGKANAASGSVTAPASTNASAPAAGTYTAGALTACAGSGVLLPAGTSPAGSNPGNPGTAGLRTDTAPGSPAAFCSATTSGNTVCGEDLQINLAANQPVKAADSNFIIIQLIAS